MKLTEALISGKQFKRQGGLFWIKVAEDDHPMAGHLINADYVPKYDFPRSPLCILVDPTKEDILANDYVLKEQ